MRADFRRPDEDDVVGSATWTGGAPTIEAADDDVRAALARVFRAVPMAVDEPSLRPFGTRGPLVIHPGSVVWFEAAARARSEAEGFRVSIVSDRTRLPAWDPAGTYRPLLQTVELNARQP
jgi:hypothetical protein